MKQSRHEEVFYEVLNDCKAEPESQKCKKTSKNHNNYI